MRLTRKMETDESRERWAFIDKSDQEIGEMNEWKKTEADSIENQKKRFESKSDEPRMLVA